MSVGAGPTAFQTACFEILLRRSTSIAHLTARRSHWIATTGQSDLYVRIVRLFDNQGSESLASPISRGNNLQIRTT